MPKSIAPDYLFRHYYEVTPEFLKKIGVDAVLSDIDNTLAPYEMPLPDINIKAWVKSLADNGIKLALISNNDKERVDLFNSELGLPAYAKVGKPKTKMIKKAMSELSATREHCAILGDQLLTDAWAARNLGVRVIIVPPIRDKKNLFFRAKRLLERPIMRKFIRKHGYTATLPKETDT